MKLLSSTIAAWHLIENVDALTDAEISAFGCRKGNYYQYEKVVSNGGIAINQRASSKFLERIFQHKNGKAIIPAHFILFFKVKTIGMDVTTIINCLVTKMIKSARFH